MPDLLNRLRFLALSCRSSARLDLFRVCSQLDDRIPNAGEIYAEALMRTLGQALDQRPAIRAPGADPSFDELWLMCLIERRIAQDESSIFFLLNRRIAPDRQRAFLTLINGLARNLPLA